jgi:raffinose/stachyose/melibiose transport system permease protein
MNKTAQAAKALSYLLLIAMTLIIASPVLVILVNSFKGKFFISDNLFAPITQESFVGFSNYLLGFTRMRFFDSFLTSLFVTIASTFFIVILCSMTAWYIMRVKSKWSSVLYYLFVFAMIVPFQMVMFTMSWMSSSLSLGNPLGILIMYIGFGSGMSIFMISGFVKTVPLEIEESAEIDGCTPVQTFFHVVIHILMPIAVTVAILNAMWIWNDYLLPLLVLDSKYTTLPIAIQKIFTGSYGGRYMGGLMAMLVLSIIPIIMFYISAQKHIIAGVTAGAVKG